MAGPAVTLHDQTAALELLRRAFPPKQVGKIPASQGRPALDYVGHAAVTDRLIAADPDWTYTIDHEFQHGQSFWIRGTLTVHGVSRVEYGEGKNPLEAVSHFIRRSAMRFGVALDLWSKEELQTSADLEPRSTVADAPRPGMGEADGGAVPYGEGGTAPSHDDGAVPPVEYDKSDLSFHPNKPHDTKPSPDFPGYLMCTKAPCPYWEYVGSEDRRVEETKPV